jgi:hypothetical protein
VDYFTKYAEAIPTHNQTAETTKKFFKTVFSRLDYPNVLLTDQGTNFMSHDVQNFLKEKGVKPVRTTAYHPQTNGLCERFNGTLVTSLRKYVAKHPGQWDLFLEDAVSSYNRSVQETNGVSPHVMMFGREPKIPGDQFLPYRENVVKSTTEMEEIYQRVIERQEEAHQHQKKYYDKKVKETEQTRRPCTSCPTGATETS